MNVLCSFLDLFIIPGIKKMVKIIIRNLYSSISIRKKYLIIEIHLSILIGDKIALLYICLQGILAQFSLSKYGHFIEGVILGLLDSMYHTSQSKDTIFLNHVKCNDSILGKCAIKQ